jgi:hypothetical protein
MVGTIEQAVEKARRLGGEADSPTEEASEEAEDEASMGDDASEAEAEPAGVGG